MISNGMTYVHKMNRTRDNS